MTRTEATTHAPPAIDWADIDSPARANGSAQAEQSSRADLGAERAVLGALLLAPQFTNDVDAILHDEDWWLPAHRDIWVAITERYFSERPIDPVLLAADVGMARSLQGHGGPLYVADLADQPGLTVTNAEHHARIIAARAQERRVENLGIWLTQAARSGTDPDTIAARLEKHTAAAGKTGAPSRYQQLRDALLDAEGLKTITPPQPLVAGHIARDSLTWLQGKPGHAKSFVAIDIACSVSTGRPWRGEAVHQGTVLYVIAEGASGLGLRIDAWRDAHGTRELPNLHFLPVPVQLLEQADNDALRRIVTDLAPSLVVLDTQARVTVGAEENSSRDMGLFVAAADHIREASGACVLVVHHEGRSGEHLRGSTAMEGAATTIIRASKDGPVVYLECKKQKDADEFPEIAMRLVPLGPSAVISHEAVGVAAITTETEHQLISTLRDSFGPEGVASSNLREAAGLPKTTYFRALRNLSDRGAITNIGTDKAPRYVLGSSVRADLQSSLSVDDEDAE